MDAMVAQTACSAAAGPATAVLSLTGVRRSWPGAAAPVLDGVDLVLPPGTTTAVTGRNGAGKTTLLRIAAGLVAPDAGTVLVEGRDLAVERRACQRRTGVVAAGGSGLYGRLDVDQHLAFWSRLALVPRAERPARIRAVTERFALAELAGRRVDRLSMGQRQRLRIALALLPGPTLLLLDEPATSLDAEGTELLAAAVADLQAAGGAALVCAPTEAQAGVVADRCLVVRDGRLEDA